MNKRIVTFADGTWNPPLNHGDGSNQPQVEPRCLAASSCRADNLVSYLDKHGWPPVRER